MLRRFRGSALCGGFSLLELSVSLMVLSLLLGGALTIASDRVNKRHIETDEEKLAVIQTALDAFIAREGRVPCVAVRTDAPGAATLGREILYVESPANNCAKDTTVPAGTLRAESSPGSGKYVRIGAVPVRALLINDSYMYDSYGNRFTYIMTEKLSKSSSYPYASGEITVNDGTGVDIITDGSYAVIAHGKDGKGAYIHDLGSEKTACGASSNQDVQNCNGDGIVTQSLYNDGVVEAKYFDDQLVWASKTEMMTGVTVPPMPKFTYILPKTIYYFMLNNLVADINNDGFADVFSQQHGNTEVTYGKADMPETISYAFALADTESETRLSSFTYGYFLNYRSHGDLNGDGFTDMVVGNYGPTGGHNIIFGSDAQYGPFAAGAVTANTLTVNPTGFTLDPDGYSHFNAVGDIDNDSYDDLIVPLYEHVNKVGDNDEGRYRQ